MLYYDQTIAISASVTGAAASYVYSANGLYDPDITGTGHQPMGFDQLMLFFEQYHVYRSSILVRVTAYQVPVPVTVCLTLNPDTSLSTTAGVLMENGLCTSQLIPGNLSGQTGAVHTLQLDCDVLKYFRRNKKSFANDPDLAGGVASNPNEQVYFGISVWQSAGLSTTANVSVNVLLFYDAIFTEPRKVAQS